MANFEELKVGTTVRLKENESSTLKEGAMGVVVTAPSSEYGTVGVVFDNFTDGHNLNGRLKGKLENKGWFLLSNEVDIVEHLFKAGDRVVVTSALSHLCGKKGTVIAVRPTGVVAVTIDNYTGGHSCETAAHYITEEFVDNSGWWFREEQLELITEEVTPCEPANSHYLTTVQPIETMRANMSPEAFKGYLRGNIVKYACRFGKKDDELKEAEKLLKYAQWLVEVCQDKELTLD